MPNFKESGALYITPKQVQLDLNVIPQLVQPVGNCLDMPCNIHRGDPKAAFDLGALGRDPTLASYGYFSVSFAKWLASGRSVFIAATGESFRIMNIPSVRTRFAATAHVKCLLELYLQAPDGIPHIFYETTYAEGLGVPASIDTYIPA